MVIVNGIGDLTKGTMVHELVHVEIAQRMGPHLFFGSDNGGRCWSHTVERGDWNGAIDELRIYDYALTAEQVTNDFKKP